MFKGKRGPIKNQVWVPKKWLPKYDMIVALYAAGISQRKIAVQLRMTPVAVGWIIRSPQGESYLKQLQAKQKERIDKGLNTRLTDLMEICVENVERVVKDPILINENPFAVFDRSITVLKGLGKLVEDKKRPDEDSPRVQNNNVIFGSPEIAARIIKGLEQVEVVRKLQAGKEVVAEPTASPAPLLKLAK